MPHETPCFLELNKWRIGRAAINQCHYSMCSKAIKTEMFLHLPPFVSKTTEQFSVLTKSNQLYPV